MRILIVEDMPGFAIPLAEELQLHGHEVAWIIGATNIRSNILVGIRSEQTKQDLEPAAWSRKPEHLVEIPFHAVDWALVDGELAKPLTSGESFARALSNFGIPCISITGGGAGTDSMTEAGCCGGLPKEYALIALRTGSLSFARNGVERHQTREELAQFTSRTRESHLAARKHRQKFITHFAVLDGARSS
jgi:hypothetical protein